MDDDSARVLALAEEQIEQLRGIYQESLEGTCLPDLVPARVKGILENQRSALDYAAVHVARFGNPGRKPAYPLPSAQEALDRDLGRLLPRSRSHPSRPGRHRACAPVVVAGPWWVAELARRSNEHQHFHLVTRVREETRWQTVDVPGGPLVMRPWDDGQGGLVINEA